MIALIEQNPEQIAALCRQYGVARLEVFGSAATGAFNFNTSDIDLIVRFGAHERLNLFERYFGFVEDLERLFKHPIDLLTDQRFHNPYFAQSVAESRHLVYEQSNDKVSVWYS